MGDIEFPRGEACPQITADRIDIWFIDGNIFIHQITKVAHSKFHHGKVPLYGIFAQKAALMLKPQRIGEMMQGKQHMNAILVQQRNFLSHLFNLFLQKLALLRLQPGPLQPKAVVTNSHFRH